VLDLKVRRSRFEELVPNRRRHRGHAPGFLEKRGWLRACASSTAIVMCDLRLRRHRPLPRPPVTASPTTRQTLQPVIDDDGFARILDQANIGITAVPARAIGILMRSSAQKTGEAPTWDRSPTPRPT
jgi:hypothetical protein